MLRLAYVATCVFCFGCVATAQPLVTGDLSVYYSFDGFSNEVIDHSWNELKLNGVVHGNVTISDGIRGQSALFDRESLNEPGSLISIGGCDGENLDKCGEIPPSRVPTSALTVAAWVKLERKDSDQSIFSSRSGSGSFPTIFQAQDDGQLRFHLRSDSFGTIAAAWSGIDGSDGADDPWPDNEWFHYLAMFDQARKEWSVYYDGFPIQGQQTISGAPLGNWGQGATLGMTSDRARQLYGQIDEFYIFTRTLSVDEIQKLALRSVALCDIDRDSYCNVADIDALSANIASGVYDWIFDIKYDSHLDLADQTAWRTLASIENGFADPYLSGDANLDGIVNATDLNALALNWQQEQTPWSGGDFTADGIASSADLNELALNWQQSTSRVVIPSGAAASVPEPRTPFILILILMLTIASKRAAA